MPPGGDTVQGPMLGQLEIQLAKPVHLKENDQEAYRGSSTALSRLSRFEWIEAQVLSF